MVMVMKANTANIEHGFYGQHGQNLQVKPKIANIVNISKVGNKGTFGIYYSLLSSPGEFLHLCYPDDVVPKIIIIYGPFPLLLIIYN